MSFWGGTRHTHTPPILEVCSWHLLVIVSKRQLVRLGNEEVISQAHVLVVMHNLEQQGRRREGYVCRMLGQ